MLVFSAIHLVPGDVTMAIPGAKRSPKKEWQAREQLGLNDPLYIQYGRYLSKALQGDLGTSIRNNLPVAKAIRDQMPSTIVLALSALVVAVSIGSILGMLASANHGTWLDTLVMGLSVSGLSIPTFWMGLLANTVILRQPRAFPEHLKWFDPFRAFPARPDFGTSRSAVVARMVRASMLDVRNREYITTARAKGLPEYVVILKHALRALIQL